MVKNWYMLMKSTLIFLNGYYDQRYPEFYKQEIAWGLENSYPLICADGGVRLFRDLNQAHGTHFCPNVLIGDLDSIDEITAVVEQLRQSSTHIVREWIGKVDKDYTDGQLAVAYAIEECDSHEVLIYGGLPRPNEYETDHFWGNLKLMRFGLRLFENRSHAEPRRERAWKTEMRDPLQTIHFVVSNLRLERKNAGLQRVSLVAEHEDVVVERSTDLRWDLAALRVDPDLTNALRNEFVADADCAMIRLVEGSNPVYIIHNWYEM